MSRTIDTLQGLRKADLANSGEKPKEPVAACILDRPFAKRDVLAVSRLNSEERRVCALFGTGHSNKQVATILDMGLRTVEGRRQKIGEKLGLDDTKFVVIWAARHLEFLLPEDKADEAEVEILPPPPVKSRVIALRIPRQPAGPCAGDPSVEEIYARARDLREGKAVLQCFA
jgi:DNA-binding CsgD family transcriptional regulator